MKIELNDQEAKNLIILLDLAVKGGGLGAAEAAFIVAKKIQDAAAAVNPAVPSNVVSSST